MRKEYKLFYWLLTGATIIVILLWVGTILFHAREDRGYEMNLFTEGLGVGVSILVTVLGINVAYERRDKKRLRQRLKREAGSRANAIAIAAVEWIRAEGWLEGDDGLLKGEDLTNANLQGADLRYANLHGTCLKNANLKYTDMSHAQVQHAKLFGADLLEARLFGTDFSYAKLQHTDLRGTSMKIKEFGKEQRLGVDFFSDDFDSNHYQANLQYADLDGSYLENAVLPHGSRLYWVKMPLGERFDLNTNVADMDKYTKRKNAEFCDTLEKIEGRRLGMRAVAFSDAYAGFDHDDD